MAEVNDAYTGNNDVGQAAQTGFMDFWAIATAQAKYWNAPYTMANLHTDETMLIQAGAVANAYIENSSLNLALIGLKFELKTPVVYTMDVIPGSKIDVDLLKMEASTNRALLARGFIHANETLEAKEELAHIQAKIEKMETNLSEFKTGTISARVAEQIRL